MSFQLNVYQEVDLSSLELTGCVFAQRSGSFLRRCEDFPSPLGVQCFVSQFTAVEGEAQ